MTEQRKPMSIRLSQQERERIEEVAQANGETTSGWMRRMLISAIRERDKKVK